MTAASARRPFTPLWLAAFAGVALATAAPAHASDAGAAQSAAFGIDNSLAPFMVEKMGGLDRDCDGAPDAGYGVDRVIARAGDCVSWRVEATNISTEPQCDLTLSDRAPIAVVTVLDRPILETDAQDTEGACKVVEGVVRCQVGSRLDVDGDGTAERYCLRPGDGAAMRYSVKVR